MFSYQGRQLLESGDPPHALGHRTKGDPFTQYWHKLAPLGTVGGLLTIVGAVDFMDCPFRFNVNLGSCDPIITVFDSAAATPFTYMKFGTTGEVESLGSSEFGITALLAPLVFRGGSGVPGGIRMRGLHFDALVVEDNVGTNVLRVDTNAPGHVFIGDGPTWTGGLMIGEQGLKPGYALYKQSPNGVYWNGDARTILHQDPAAMDRLVFGTIGGVTTGQNTFVFGQDVQLLGGFSLNRLTVNGLNNVLAVACEYTYVGYNGANVPGVTITLPPTAPTYGTTGAKPGQLLIIKDETGMTPPVTNDITVNTPDGALIDGLPNLFLNEKGFTWLQSDGVDWRVIGS